MRIRFSWQLVDWTQLVRDEWMALGWKSKAGASWVRWLKDGKDLATVSWALQLCLDMFINSLIFFDWICISDGYLYRWVVFAVASWFHTVIFAAAIVNSQVLTVLFSKARWQPLLHCSFSDLLHLIWWILLHGDSSLFLSLFLIFSLNRYLQFVSCFFELALLSNPWSLITCYYFLIYSLFVLLLCCNMSNTSLATVIIIQRVRVCKALADIWRAFYFDCDVLMGAWPSLRSQFVYSFSKRLEWRASVWVSVCSCILSDPTLAFLVALRTSYRDLDLLAAAQGCFAQLCLTSGRFLRLPLNAFEQGHVLFHLIRTAR